MSLTGSPTSKAERLLALKQTTLPSSPQEKHFEHITRLAASIFDVEICLVSFTDNDKQWFKSKAWVDNCRTSHSISLSNQAILQKGVFVVDDALQAAWFTDNPLLAEVPNIHFCAGAPLYEASGNHIGTLYLVDTSSRSFSLLKKQQLRDFAGLIESEIAKGENEYFDPLPKVNSPDTALIIEKLHDLVFVLDRQFSFTMFNKNHIFLKQSQNILGQNLRDIFPRKLAEEIAEYTEKAFCNSMLIHQKYKIDEVNVSLEMLFQKVNEKEVLVIIRHAPNKVSTQSEVRRLSEIAKQTTNGVVVTDEHGLVVWVNEAFSAITGYSINEMIGSKPGRLLQGENTDIATVEKMRAAMSLREGFDVELINYSKSRTPYWIRISCNPFLDENGEFCGYIAIETDITKEKISDETIRDNKSLLDAVIDANAIGVWRLNLLNGELIINDKWAALLGYELDELMPTNRETWERLTHPDDLIYATQQINEYVTGLASHYNVNIRMKHKNGRWKWISTRGKVVSNSKNGEVEWLLGTHFDIDEQLQAQSQLKEASSQMKAVVDNLLDGVITINSKGTILTANEAAKNIFGYSNSELLGNNISLLMDSPHREHHDNYLASYLRRGVSDITGRIRELDALHKNGTTFPIELGVVEVTLDDDTNFIGIVRDITDRKKREEKIHELAFYDPLTSLPNRRLFLDRLYLAQSNCNLTGSYAALLFLDLDNFKNLNDSAGHDKGDQLLCQVAERLVKTFRRGDTVSRMGGDEFLILATELGNIENVAAKHIKALAQKLLTTIEKQYDISGTLYKCTASVGITLFNRVNIPAGDLVKQADMAMYKAKMSGRNRLCFFDPKMQDDVNAKVGIIQELHAAISDQQFVLYYQKQVDSLGQFTGVEVLLRWFHPVKGMISPADFIPIAEDTGLIVPIGQWVLEQACERLALWACDPATEALTIAVNISVIQFNKENFVQTVVDALESSGANPHRLKLELTENMLASDIVSIKAKMNALQKYGVMFSIDDFGTGYSSLFYLKQLPLNQLKIDQAFVKDILFDVNDKAIAQSVITLAESLSLEVIAEGVETESQHALLKNLGCNAYQGFLFGKPCKIEELLFD